ncbi:DUF2268 domain-containing putative Zn-dependent protease [Spelaeicoccus albus]|uniref:Uncharacterized protein YjaZ n=1 Tax=Spelaeicoccus albus TaxID=1280376 RepID=A0A7Z0CZP2_9MICO|nr:DUF2268 domain-containing putative Zn-dependent protease [Spelaeicoccus albus]NYI66536.1 uncharacterized protein YjaZ [Spelaeicoccus albus]
MKGYPSLSLSHITGLGGLTAAEGAEEFGCGRRGGVLSVQVMTITVLDTYTGMRDVLAVSSPERPEAVRAMLRPAADMYKYFPGEVDLVQMHRMGSGFPIDGDDARCLDAVETLRAADAWGRIDRALTGALAVQQAAVPALDAPDITVLLMLGNPQDIHFMDEVLGVVGNGSMPGYIAITLWPSEENLARLEATAVHELNHNLRYSRGGVVWDPGSVTAGEQIVSEGLADAFARQLYGDELGYTRIGVPHLHADDVFAKVVTGLDVTGMQNFTAWVHGDASAVRFGAEPVGLPTGAGYAAGGRLVDTYLDATGKRAADALFTPSREIIDTALERLR